MKLENDVEKSRAEQSRAEQRGCRSGMPGKMSEAAVFCSLLAEVSEQDLGLGGSEQESRRAREHESTRAGGPALVLKPFG